MYGFIGFRIVSDNHLIDTVEMMGRFHIWSNLPGRNPIAPCNPKLLLMLLGSCSKLTNRGFLLSLNWVPLSSGM